MARTTENRLHLYATYAAVPTAGLVAGTSVAGDSDFYHYGGPAIEITRNMSDTFEQAGSRSYVQYGVFFGTLEGGSATVKNADFGMKNAAAQLRDLEGDLLGSDRKAVMAAPNAAFGKKRVEDEGVLIDRNMSFKDNVAMLSASINSQTEFGDFERDQYGSWQTDGEEVRGFLALAGPLDGDGFEGYGWMDIGWDGDTLTLYDWAVNFAGTIETGQTSASSAVPGAGGLAALAMGAAGLRRRRKRSA
ncbi:MAG: hypothetical protein MK082_01680 [Phycisphaerales bacterium]|nr:hypothetical protein [Phycisphaerales bacterium]